jgi:hypothetical protein
MKTDKDDHDLKDHHGASTSNLDMYVEFIGEKEDSLNSSIRALEIGNVVVVEEDLKVTSYDMITNISNEYLSYEHGVIEDRVQNPRYLKWGGNNQVMCPIMMLKTTRQRKR